MNIIEKLVKVAENTQKVYDAGYKKAKETFCPPINKTGSVVQCCPLEGELITIDVGDIGIETRVTICGKNLYNPIKYPLVDGYYINKGSGAEAGGGSHTEYCATRNYIPVAHLRGKKINLNYIPGGSAPGMAFYDADKVRTDPIYNGKGNDQTVPDGAVYMRFSTYINQKESVQIELGSASTGYEPYAQKQYVTSDETRWKTEPLKGVNTIFACDTADGSGVATVTVTGTTDPVAESERLTDILTAMGVNTGSTTEEE